MDKVNPIIAVAITALIIEGGNYAIQRMTGKPDTGASGTTINISGANNGIIQYGSNSLKITPEDFERSIIQGAGNKHSLASNAVKTLKPAKTNENLDGSAIIDDNTDLVISNATIKEIPRFIDRSPYAVQREFLTNAEILVRSTDLDNREKGWNVIIPQLGERRMKLELDPKINSTFLLRSDPLFAEIEVYFTQNAEGTRNYRKAFLRSIKAK